MSHHYDVAIIGGGPAGTTAASLLRKYNPDLRVLILEREKFPRDHVGESQLPVISKILNEMGAWDKVEAAGFPIKIGATYKWGSSQDLWDFEFTPGLFFGDEARPQKFEGKRKFTAFQVDRAVYDDILLRHAEELGAEVREETKVVEVFRDGDTVTGLKLGDESVVTATHYVDASGGAGVLRKAMGVETEIPAQLRNIAVWDYWQNAEWAVSIGVGGTRVQVMSLGYGWLWFIPLGPTRTSIGLVVPADYYKASGKKPEELYLEAIAAEPRISELTANAEREGKFAATKDWSFVADRMAGSNWFLAGESAGFADPILAAGMTLAHVGAMEVAYTILELQRGRYDAQWLIDTYTDSQVRRIRQHIRFANFWYSANGQFTDLQEYTREIARDAGLEMDAKEAFRWLGTGGFANDRMEVASIAAFSVESVKQLVKLFTKVDPGWEINKYNRFKLDLTNSEIKHLTQCENGEIKRLKCYVRGSAILSMEGIFKPLIKTLLAHEDLESILTVMRRYYASMPEFDKPDALMVLPLSALETMVLDGWVIPSTDPSLPTLELLVPESNLMIHPNRDEEMMAARS